MTAFTLQIVKAEGLWRGLWLPGLLANMGAVGLSQGLRIGLYPAVRDGISSAKSSTVTPYSEHSVLYGNAG